MLEKIKKFVEQSSWKTFFKMYFLAVLYALLVCIFDSDGFGFCFFLLFPNPFIMLMTPVAFIFDFHEINFGFWSSFLALTLIFVFLINVYRFFPEKLQCWKYLRNISLGLKCFLFLYTILVVLIYLYIFFTVGYCSPCGLTFYL